MGDLTVKPLELAAVRTVSYEGWGWLGAPLAIDLANSLPLVRPGEQRDLLDGPEALAQWLAAQGPRLPALCPTAEDLRRFRALRDALHHIFSAVTHDRAPSRDALEAVNRTATSIDRPETLRLTPDGVRAELGAGRAAQRAVCLVARSAIRLWLDAEIDRLTICEAPGCSMFFLAREGQQWCSVACGNRARAARHTQRARGRSTARLRPRPGAR